MIGDQTPYEPFDQDVRLPPPPWKPTDPELVAWETAHGHDVRLKCFSEFGCLVIEASLERQVTRIQAERDVLQQCIDQAVTRLDVAIADSDGMILLADVEWIRSALTEPADR